MTRTNWELAGMVNDDGTLAGAVSGDGWLVPGRIALDGDALVWALYAPPIRDKRVTAERGLLDAFIRLTDATPEQILAFASRYGVLTIGMQGREPLSDWWQYARSARAIVNVAARLHRGEHGADEDWRVIQGADAHTWTEIPIEGERIMLVEAVNSCPSQLPTLRLGWPRESGFALTIHTPTMLSAVALALMMAVSDAHGLAVCDGCHIPYMRERRAQRGRRNYCPTCGLKAAQRDAASDYRRRKRERD